VLDQHPLGRFRVPVAQGIDQGPVLPFVLRAPRSGQ